MANALYPTAKAAMLTGGVNLASSDVKVLLVDLDEYTYSDSHDMLDDVPSEARVALSGNLGSKTTTGGTFDSANPAFTAATGAESEALIVFVDTGTPSTSRLVAYFDTGVTGLPVLPNSGDIQITVNASGWFTL